MTREATKTRAFWGPEVLSLLRGDGIDIGCGPDPVTPEVDRFDVEDGDANAITHYVSWRYDFVFSSHTLEHMRDPHAALREWFTLVKPGGHLIVIVPDEDLYEQGHFPSIFNGDHKWTFTIGKARSWSPKSINVLDLVRSVPAEVVGITLQDHRYDRRLLRFGSTAWGRWTGKRIQRVAIKFPSLAPAAFGLARVCHAVVDQTAATDGALAQIQVVLRRPGSVSVL